MKKWMTVIFASMFALALSMPAWSQNNTGTTTTNTDKGDKGKNDKNKKKKGNKKGDKKGADKDTKKAAGTTNKKWFRCSGGPAPAPTGPPILSNPSTPSNPEKMAARLRPN